MQLLDQVRRTIQRYDLARPGTRVVVALSGGSDSVALAHLLRLMHDAGELSVVGVAHFNHELRPAADDEERFCWDMAGSFGWPFLADRENVSGRARREGRSLEDAARTARHEFLERARRSFAADVVALGHTRDDQAETFLLRLVRGAGARGLAAMHPKRGRIIRPLLDCRRTDLREYLRSRGIAFVHDASNDDVSIPRNRVRAELVPLLERRFNPSVVAVLAHEAEIAREEWHWMEASVDEVMPRVCRTDGESLRLDAEALASLPLALARTVMRRAMISQAGGRPVGFPHVEEALRVAQAGGAVDLPRHRVQRIGADVVLSSRTDTTAGRGRKTVKAGANFFCHPLSIPGEVGCLEAGWVVTAEPAPSLEAAALHKGGASGRGVASAVVQRDPCGAALAVRSWRPGDRFRPLGLAGHKKLQDFFVDRKVARQARDLVPLVVDELDRIVWVAGHSIGDDFRVTDPAQAVLILRLKPVGGPA
jgi:tRNA(Ile)-lysidine synthase